jgi:hypothetical protein
MKEVSFHFLISFLLRYWPKVFFQFFAHNKTRTCSSGVINSSTINDCIIIENLLDILRVNDLRCSDIYRVTQLLTFLESFIPPPRLLSYLVPTKNPPSFLSEFGVPQKINLGTVL